VGTSCITTTNRYIDFPIKGYDHVEEGDYVTVTISDTGIGISKADMERIFEPFYTKKVMGRSGTGLGMAVVWGTMKDHNGYIDLVSQEGRHTFILYFPVCREAERSEEAVLTVNDYGGNGEVILVVDDVATQRELASAMLTKLGYRVATVASGEEAWSCWTWSWILAWTVSTPIATYSKSTPVRKPSSPAGFPKPRVSKRPLI
jgi:two-component system cell cycle sensor histidine kinase/response regulator CckA